MMKNTTNCRPAVRHKRSQNLPVVYTLVDEVMAVVDSLMRVSLQLKRLLSQRLEALADPHDEEDLSDCSHRWKSKLARSSDNDSPMRMSSSTTETMWS